MSETDRPMEASPMTGWEALRWLRSRLRLRPGRTLVGIDGLAGSGKTTFADELGALVWRIRARHHPDTAGRVAAPGRRPATNRAWDYSVWLDLSIEDAYRRLHEKHGTDPDPRAATNAHSYDSQLQYLAACHPAGCADLIVDNSRPHPATD